MFRKHRSSYTISQSPLAPGIPFPSKYIPSPSLKPSKQHASLLERAKAQLWDYILSVEQHEAEYARSRRQVNWSMEYKTVQASHDLFMMAMCADVPVRSEKSQIDQDLFYLARREMRKQGLEELRACLSLRNWFFKQPYTDS